MRGRSSLLTVGALALLSAAGCGAGAEFSAPAKTAPPAASASTAPSSTGPASTTPAPTATAPAPTTTAAPTTEATMVAPTTAAATTVAAGPSAAEVGANELGVVPILMYHQLLAAPASVYDRTPAEFRAELERLASEGYVPITAAEYARGDFSAVPAGRHPVVLTFDDSTTSQFDLDDNGAPVPGTAVAILLEVAAAHPGFRPVATFYVNRNPFADKGGATTLPWLAANGFEIGNHTREHKSLAELSPADAADQIASMQAVIEAAVPGYVVSTIALPFGARPPDPSVALNGAAGGVAYAHAAVMQVGANPATSPFAAAHNPAVVARIRSQGPTGPDAAMCSSAWLDKLAANPATRFTSDGDPNVISFPAARAGDLAPHHTAAARPY